MNMSEQEYQEIINEVMAEVIEEDSKIDETDEAYIEKCQDDMLKKTVKSICSYINSKYLPRCNKKQKNKLRQILATIPQYANGLTNNYGDDDYENYYDSYNYYPRKIYYYCYEFDFKRGTIEDIDNNYFKYIRQNTNLSLLYIKFDIFGVSIKYGPQKIFMPFDAEKQYQGIPTKKELGDEIDDEFEFEEYEEENDIKKSKCSSNVYIFYLFDSKITMINLYSKEMGTDYLETHIDDNDNGSIEKIYGFYMPNHIDEKFENEITRYLVINNLI